jgi:hypothetical protein
MTHWMLRILLVSLTLEIMPVYAAPIPFAGTMTIHNEQLSLRVAGTPLRQVMEELSRLSGTQVLWLNDIAREEPVSVEFNDLLLSEGLSRILAGKNFMLFYSSAARKARLTQIWISSRGNSKPAFTLPTVSAAEPLSEAEEADSPEQDDLASIPLEQLQQIAVHDQDASVRARAVVYLEDHAWTDPRAIVTLTQIAEYDPNLQVQSGAAEVLQGLHETLD